MLLLIVRSNALNSNMTKIMKRTLTILLGFSCVIILFGCANTRIEHLSGTEFINKADQINQLNSFFWTTYIGASGHKAYLEVERPAFVGKGTRTTVFWTALTDLPKDVVQQIKTGNAPWMAQNIKTNRNHK